MGLQYIGAILAKEGEDRWNIHPVAYANRTLQQNEHNYQATELKEALEVVWSVKHFRHYMYGPPDFYRS